MPIQPPTKIRLGESSVDLAVEMALCTHPETRERAFLLYSSDARDRRGFSFDSTSPETMQEIQELIEYYITNPPF